MHVQTLKALSFGFLIIFTIITGLLLLFTGGGVIWFGFSATVCDGGCGAIGVWGAQLYSVVPYVLLIAAIVGWKSYLAQHYKKSLLFTWGLALFWFLLIYCLFYFDRIPRAF